MLSWTKGSKSIFYLADFLTLGSDSIYPMGYIGLYRPIYPMLQLDIGLYAEPYLEPAIEVGSLVPHSGTLYHDTSLIYESTKATARPHEHDPQHDSRCQGTA